MCGEAQKLTSISLSDNTVKQIMYVIASIQEETEWTTQTLPSLCSKLTLVVRAEMPMHWLWLAIHVGHNVLSHDYRAWNSTGDVQCAAWLYWRKTDSMWSNGGLCTDGAPSMVRRWAGLCTLVMNVSLCHIDALYDTPKATGGKRPERRTREIYCSR